MKAFFLFRFDALEILLASLLFRFYVHVGFCLVSF